MLVFNARSLAARSCAVGTSMTNDELLLSRAKLPRGVGILLVAGVESLPASEVSSLGVATEETVSLSNAVDATLFRACLPLAEPAMDGAGDELLLASKDARVERRTPLLAVYNVSENWHWAAQLIHTGRRG